MLDLDILDFAKGGGVVTVVAQDVESGSVLMVAQANREALERSIATGEMHYLSRVRGLWRKGETSGNVQLLVSLHGDCDGDAVLARVQSEGPACHTGTRSCFGDDALASDALGRLAATIDARANEPEDLAPADSEPPTMKSSYTRRLLNDRNLRLKKIGEESAELVAACADGDGKRAAEECADLFYHSLVALRAVGASLRDVRKALEARARARKH